MSKRLRSFVRDFVAVPVVPQPYEGSVDTGGPSRPLRFEGVTDPFPVDQAKHYTGLVVGRLTNT